MEGYLGETIVKAEETEFKDFTPADWAMYFVERYGGIDGAHHKDWVLDQVARVLKGTPLVIKLARWDNGHKEYRVSTGEPSQEYKDWVLEMMGEYDEEFGDYEYGYDEGIAP